MADLEIDSNLSGSVGSSISGSFGAVGPVTLSGLPDTYTIKVPEIAKVSIGVDPLESKVTLRPVKISFDPIDSNIAIKEIPSVRAHLPVNYCVGFSWLGFEFAAIRLCGEGMIITEPFDPNPCEVCDSPKDPHIIDSKPAGAAR